MTDEEVFAFPLQATVREHEVLYEPHFGMLLRDYFAANVVGHLVSLKCPPTYDASAVARKIAAKSYLIADAMLEARKK